MLVFKLKTAFKTIYCDLTKMMLEMVGYVVTNLINSGMFVFPL